MVSSLATKERLFYCSALFKKPSVLLLLFSCCFALWFQDFLKPFNSAKNENNFVWDAFGYYSYLPSTFYYNGSFEFGNNEWFLPITPDGRHYPKYTYGVALMEAPFYGAGYLWARATSQPVNGFTAPFAESVRWGAILYVFIGLFFLRKFLLLYFTEVPVAIALFSCLFGSLLYMYTFMQGEISHGYLFFLFSLFLFYTQKWHLEQKRIYSVILAALLGLISVIRFTEIYIALVFIFWNVKTLGDLRQKFLLLFKHYLQLLWFPLLGFLFWIPQFIFWKHHLGTYFYDTYVNEKFFWGDPQVLNVLFSYRKGWITYTPIVLLAFAGVFFVRKGFPLSRFSFVFLIALTVYVFSCWWDWAYGGCFGSRAFCPLICILSVPIAAISETVLNAGSGSWLKNLSGAALLAFVFLCSFQNIGQSYQYMNQRQIHPWATSRFIFWGTFRQYQYGGDFVNPYWSELLFRNEGAWRNGEERNDTKIYRETGK